MTSTAAIRALACTVVLIAAGVAQPFAQERLIVVRDTGQLVELETSDARLGAVRKIAQFPPLTSATKLMGGRYLLLQKALGGSVFPPVPATTLTALFDTRDFGGGVMIARPSLLR
jgi:hypothetical protein